MLTFFELTSEKLIVPVSALPATPLRALAFMTGPPEVIVTEQAAEPLSPVLLSFALTVTA